MIEFVPLEYYRPVYYGLMLALCCITGFLYVSSPGCKRLLQQNSGVLPLLFAVVITVYLGLRPVSGKYFIDMIMYNHLWNVVDLNQQIHFFDLHTEWFFRYLVIFCKKLVHDSSFWFLIVEIFYVGGQIWACKKLLKENLWLPLLFVLFSSPFFTYGTNGIRNGMACSLTMLSIAFFCDRNMRGYIVGTFIFIIALGCHRSVMLPMTAFLTSAFIIRDLKKALIVWFLCILFSAVGGKFFQNLILGLGFDDRMSRYDANEKMYQFSQVGFRWDFLLFSSLPIILVYHVIKKKIHDRVFNLLAGTYILSNSVWVLVCRVAFSNRFAYLSWFLYGLVIAYAIVRLPIWQDQDKVAGWVLIASSVVTMILGNL